MQWYICVTLGLAILSDVIITASLCWYLHKSRTEFEKTNSMIDKLLLYTINTGLLTMWVACFLWSALTTLTRCFASIFNSAVLICVSEEKNQKSDSTHSRRAAGKRNEEQFDFYRTLLYYQQTWVVYSLITSDRNTYHNKQFTRILFLQCKWDGAIRGTTDFSFLSPQVKLTIGYHAG